MSMMSSEINFQDKYCTIHIWIAWTVCLGRGLNLSYSAREASASANAPPDTQSIKINLLLVGACSNAEAMGG